MTCATISSIDPSVAESWREPVFITIDIDWAGDQVIEDTADLLEEAGVAATWFVTHDTPVIERLRANPLWEIGIHPNFNFLLNGDPQKGRTAQEVVANMMALVPDATAVRSHSLVQGSPIWAAFHAAGLTHDCNDFVPIGPDIELATYVVPPGLIKVPHFWEDDVCFALPARPDIGELARRDGLKVFDFHPIHVCVNSAVSADYEAARPHFRDFEALVDLRRDAPGARTDLMRLLELVA